MTQQWTDIFREEIDRFKDTIAAFDRGELDRKTYKGLSGGLGSYAQREDGRHMLRLRLPAGRLTPDRLKFLAGAVEQHQVGRLKLTTCETIQLHDLSPAQVPALMEAAISCGIYSKGGGGDNPRNVMCSPLSGVQPGESFDPIPYAEAVTDYLLSICRDIRMPRKLKIAFCNGVDDCVHSAFRDMGFWAREDGAFSLRIAGGLGAACPTLGLLVEERIPPSQVLYYVRAMIDTFCQHGDYEHRMKARTRFMQQTLGQEGLKQAFLDNVAALKAKGGLDLPRLEAPAAPDKGNAVLSHPRAIPQKQPGLYAVKYHPMGGMLPVEKPAQLYALLKDMEGAEIRIAPDETLYAVNLSAAEAERVLEATGDGVLTQFEQSVACVGASICQQGVRDSQRALRAMTDAVREAGIPDGALPRVCVSGCPSSCSAHQAGAIGFQGGVKLVDKTPLPAFRMFLGGDDRAGKARFGQCVATIPERDLPAMMVELGRAAAARGLDWRGWSDTCPEERDAIIAKYDSVP
ncbi:MAG: nitrite/sulfite reductase [Oscillospiraceae bacterium]|nr:nitrite/sulfite reductase [Oscillospiraceae bacterium]